MANKEAMADSWKKTVAGLPTSLARLEYLASLRNAHHGKYEHFGLAQRIGGAETDALLRCGHSEAFQEWLSMTLPEQKDQVEEYLGGLEGDRREIIANWLSIRPYANWLPAESRQVERDLFLTDLSDVLESLRRDYRVASPDPE